MKEDNNTIFHRIIQRFDYRVTKLDGISRTAPVHPLRLGKKDLESLRTLISEGLDYRKIDEDARRTVLGAVFKHIEDLSQRAVLFSDMLKMGFNPLDENLEVIAKLSNNEDMMALLEQHLVQQEASGKRMVSDNGGNLLHVLARHLESVLEDSSIDPGKPCHVWRKQWIHEADDQGNTPFHVLWGNPLLAIDAADLTHVDEAEAIRRVNVWRCHSTQTMMSMEVDFLRPNHQGQSVLDLIKGNDLSFISGRDQQDLAPFLAVLDQHTLNQGTPQAGGDSKPRMRL